jgi:hypothetical protein
MNINVIKVEVKTLSKAMFNQLEYAKCPEVTELVGQVNVPVTGGTIPEYVLARGDRLYKARHGAVIEQAVQRKLVTSHTSTKVTWDTVRDEAEQELKKLPQIFV